MLAPKVGAHHQTDEMLSTASCMLFLIKHLPWKVSPPILGPTVALT